MAAGFVALALISRRRRPWRSITFAFLLGSAMWLWLPFIAGEPYTPMVAGFAAGGVVALRAEPEHSMGQAGDRCRCSSPFTSTCCCALPCCPG